MKRSLIALAACLTLLATGSARALETVHPLLISDYYKIDNVEMTEIADEAQDSQSLAPMTYENDCSKMKAAPPLSSLADGDLSVGVVIDEIINNGRKIWQVIENNKPVVNVTTDTANALPRGVVCWTDLANWKAPQSRTYQVAYKNLWGITVVDFKFRVLFSYGGGIDGKGMYIANASIIPAGLNVLWGYTFNANLKVGQVLNIGSRENPIAGMELGLTWNIKTPVQDMQNTVNFFTQGDGVLMQLQ